MDLMTIGQAQKLTSPNPFALLSVRKNDGTTNVMAVSWWNYAPTIPPPSLSAWSSKGIFRPVHPRKRRFRLNIGGEPLNGGTIKAGCCSGRDMDKAAAIGIPLTRS